MKYLKKFAKASDYSTYLNGDDVWLPRVTYVVNASDNHTTDDKWSDQGPSWVDFSRIGDEFAQVANGGTMYFTDTVKNGVRYTAAYDASTETLILESRDSQGNSTQDISIVDILDSSGNPTGESYIAIRQ